MSSLGITLVRGDPRLLDLTPDVLRGLAPHVKGTRDDEHQRALGLIGKRIYVPAEYWDGAWAREHAGQYVARRTFAFVPGQVPRGDRWCFWNHEELDFNEQSVCPITLKSLKKCKGVQWPGDDEEKEEPAESAGEPEGGQSAGDAPDSGGSAGPTDEDSVADDTSSADDVYEEATPSEPDSDFDIDDAEWDSDYDPDERKTRQYEGPKYVCAPIFLPVCTC